MRTHAALATLVSVLSSAYAIRIYGELLDDAKSLEGVDTFLQFKPFSFTCPVGERIKSFLDNKLSLLTVDDPFEGVGEFSTPDTRNAAQKRRGLRRQAVMDVLKSYATASQAPIIESLTGQGLEVQSFWISNTLLVKKAPVAVLSMIVQLAESGEEIWEQVESLSPNRIVAKIPPVPSLVPKSGSPLSKKEAISLISKQKKSSLGQEASEASWNLKLIKVDELWKKSRGSNVVVANIDTGVDFLHPLLRRQYRGAAKGQVSHGYNWFDPEGLAPIPVDCHGHGTHTMGTIVAGEGVGIAPDARWIAAQGCAIEGCSQERLLASAQWIMCPTDAEGNNPRCDLGADIVNNSWGGDMTDDESMTWFSAAVDAWLQAGIFPIFAQGNSGPDCGTAGTPGDLETVIAVGAVDDKASLTGFSSRGPGGSILGHARFKPDYVAPGQEIISCSRGGGLIAMSGTSMAAPHVAGVVALLLSIRPDLTFDQLRAALTKTANTQCLKVPQMGSASCYGTPWDVFPNYHYGFGLVDAVSAARHIQDHLEL